MTENDLEPSMFSFSNTPRESTANGLSYPKESGEVHSSILEDATIPESVSSYAKEISLKKNDRRQTMA